MTKLLVFRSSEATPHIALKSGIDQPDLREELSTELHNKNLQLATLVPGSSLISYT